MRPWWLLAFVLTALPAAADSVLVVVASDAEIYEESVRTQAENTVRDRGFEVVPFGEAVVESGVNPSEILLCLDKSPDCLKGAVAPIGAGRVLVLQLKSTPGEGGAPQVVVTGWLAEAASGERLHSGQRFCESCSKLGALVEVSSQLVRELLDADAARSTFVRIDSQPAGATVSIDGTPMGPSGQAYPVAPGKHQVAVQLAGHATVVREIDAASNQTTTESVTLMALDGAGGSSGLSPYWKWGALGGGALLTGLGVAWIAIDGPRSEEGARLEEEYRTLVPGIVSTTIGVGLLGVSAYLFYRDARSEDDGGGLRAHVTATDASIGWAGRF